MKFIFSFIVAALFSQAVMAQAPGVSSTQKVGYLNAQAILADMSEMKAADSQLEALAKQLQAKDSLAQIAFVAKAKAFQESVQKGEVPPVKQQEEEKKLEDEKQKIVAFQQEMQQQIGKKQQELYQPVFDKVNKAIADVAKENGFTYIVDATKGSLLFADEKFDIQSLVRTKLGLPAAKVPTPK